MFSKIQLKEGVIVKFKCLIFVVTLLFVGFANAQPTAGDSSASFTPDQQKQVEKIVHDYLVANPEVLVEVSNALRQKEMQKVQELGVKASKENAEKILRASTSPVVGDAKGDITLVEFFDYQCLHCREMTPIIEKLIKANPHLRVVFKEFAVFGPNSMAGAKAALAANKQNKYFDLHQALMSSKQSLSEKTILLLAKKAGLNVRKLKKDMKDAILAQEIKANYDLAKALKLVGTPAFIIAKTDVTPTSDDASIVFFPGATTQQELQGAIDKLKKIN